ncbi:MAG: fructose-6-phosphate aldolase [Gemmatimonadota bacterium]|nr:fructose-6-phosphate aldolase [Gemmatimonadota bacterium]
MKIHLDSASISDIEWAIATGLIDGITTSPTLIEGDASNADVRAHLAGLCRLTHGPVSIEIAAVDAAEMYREGRELAKIADNVVVKIPMIEEGIVAVRRLVLDGVKVNTTLIFNAAQALLAAKAGATYVSPFVGRLDDIGHDGIAALRDIRQVFRNYDLDCEVLVEAVRHTRHFIECAKAGADIVTVPIDVLRALLLHPLTDRGLDQYLSDWSKRPARARAGV